MTAAEPLPFIDLRPGDDAATVREAIERVLQRGWFVLGPEVEAFETAFAEACGAEHAVAVGNGTDAISLLLRAHDVGPGHEVIVPALTAGYTALAVTQIGATPVFADVEADTLTINPAACAAAITMRTRAIVPVHLYGQAARLEPLTDIAHAHRLIVVEDCCQAHLATGDGRPVGTTTAGGAFSFYPTKNLGAMGDGGAVITRDPAIAQRVRRLRNGGQTERYRHDEAGVNSRLDDLQAAVLRARLPYLAGWTARRRTLAAAYRRTLNHCAIPERDPGHVYHLFPIRTARRDALKAYLAGAGIETLIHYPLPLPDHPAFAAAAGIGSDYRQARRAASELLSLPLHPRLAEADVERVAAAVVAFEKDVT